MSLPSTEHNQGELLGYKRLNALLLPSDIIPGSPAEGQHVTTHLGNMTR